jgi:VanZ family protein
LIFLLSSQAQVSPPFELVGWDKAAHAAVYGVLAGLLLWAARPAHVWALVAWAVVAALYGASDELHQSFVPGRSCDAWDWASDTAGVTLVAAVVWRWRLRQVERSH